MHPMPSAALSPLAALPDASVAIACDDDNERRINIEWMARAPSDITVEVYRTHAGWCFKGYLTVHGETIEYRH
jgi:hypothetical protein